MSGLIPFSFENQSIRVVTTDDGEPLFVAKDVATVLGYENTAQAVRVHCKHAKSLNELKVLPDSTLHPQTQLIPESDLYRLTLKSTLDSAERFQDWVVEEVLPTIRKTGKYEAPAGSWENDDEIIAAAIDMPVRLFQAHRDQLMRGWYLAADGRLYHNTITSMVQTMLSKRTNTAERVKKHREKLKEQAVVTRYQHVSNAQEQEQEQDKKTRKAKRAKSVGDGFALPDAVDVEAWSDFERYRTESKKPLTDTARKLNANLLALLEEPTDS